MIPPVFLRYPIGAHPIQKRMRIGTGNLKFGKGRKVHQTATFTHRRAFLRDGVPGIGPPKRIVFAIPFGVKPARALPAEHFLKLRAGFGQTVMHR